MALAVQKTNVAAARDSAEVLFADHDVAIGCADDVFIVMWRDRTTIQGVTTLARLFRTYGRNRVSHDAALVTIIEPNAKMPSPGSRELLARFLSDSARNLIVSGVAFEGDGFAAAGIRSVIVGLTMLARQPFPHRVFGTVTEVSRWVEFEEPRIGKYFDARVIENSVASFRSQVRRRGRGWA